MKIQVLADDGSPLFVFSSNGQGQMLSASAETPRDVTSMLLDAQAWIGHDNQVIGTIKADIQACSRRIEHELGAHPAFTWAQTHLGNAVAHLEHFVQGKWTEPPAGANPVDERGVQIVQPPPPPPKIDDVHC